jgi:pimeloyl-ACP methyl ester carboxylesterase
MTFPLILLPGMGADARMFEDQRRRFPQLTVPAWPALRPGETLRDFAARLADTVTITRDTVLGGASMGGMVALELARLKPPRAVVLLGSCRSPDAIPRSLLLAERLARPFPLWLLNLLRPFEHLARARLGPLTSPQKQLLHEMSRAHSMAFLAWAGRAILEWPGVPDPGVPVLHVHGRLDRMILPGKVAADIMLEDAGHLPSMTHPEDVNTAIERAGRLPA